MHFSSETIVNDGSMSGNARSNHYSRGMWNPAKGPLKVMVIGAHPDDPDVHCGGTAALLAAKGARVVFVSLTNGDKGHHMMSSADLARRRLAETQAAAKAYGIERYVVLGHHDCELTADLETRLELTRLVRGFGPHVIFTHRTCDYHTDHRATGQLVMDMTYLLGVPLWCPDVPIPEEKPVVFYLRDGFEYPQPLRPDLVIELTQASVDRQIAGLACHVSQFFEWLPFDMGIADEVPATDDPVAVRKFIDRYWIKPRAAFDAKRYGLACSHAEVFGLSEYGREPTPTELALLRSDFDIKEIVA